MKVRTQPCFVNLESDGASVTEDFLVTEVDDNKSRAKLYSYSEITTTTRPNGVYE